MIGRKAMSVAAEFVWTVIGVLTVGLSWTFSRFANLP